MTNDDANKTFGKLVARSWADEDFKAKLLADPATVLKDEGMEVPAGVSVNVVENSDSVFTLVLPPKPTELSDSELDSVAGGVCGAYMTLSINSLSL